MTRKDYELIARVLRESRDLDDASVVAVDTITENFITALKREHQQFSPTKFRNAVARVARRDGDELPVAARNMWA